MGCGHPNRGCSRTVTQHRILWSSRSAPTLHRIGLRFLDRTHPPSSAACDHSRATGWLLLPNQAPLPRCARRRSGTSHIHSNKTSVVARGHRMLEGRSVWETRPVLGPSSKKPCIGCRCMHVCCFQMPAAGDTHRPRGRRLHFSRSPACTTASDRQLKNKLGLQSRPPPQHRRPWRHPRLSYVPAHTKINVNGVTSAPPDADGDQHDHDDRPSRSRIPGSARRSPCSVVVTSSSLGAGRTHLHSPAF
ncbi:hypothetical protein C8Q79DRAFT_647142 [Trametes meyenii]|nr:hypothetical protein C8Q79DRAFT_647142 [Trametes meyenii]